MNMSWWALMGQYDMRLQVPLEEVAADYLPDLKPSTLARMANEQSLPFPVSRRTRKAPFMVDLKDLSDWLTRQSETARAEWEKVRT